MGKDTVIAGNRKSVAWIIILSAVCTGIIWHVIHWQNTGMYSRLFDMINEGKAWVSVIYNLGLVILLSTTLGMLMGRITEIFKHENPLEETTGRNHYKEKSK